MAKKSWFDKYLSSRDWKGRKEHREEFRHAKAWDCTCRNGGDCEYCRDSRLHSAQVNKTHADALIEDYEKDYNRD